MTNALAVSGYSAAYYAAQASPGGQRQAAGSYYVKEAPGRWFGAGLDSLGLAEGQQVEIETDEAGKVIEAGAFFDVYDQQRHPVTGQMLGRAPNRRDQHGNRTKSAGAELERLLAAEPHADAKRLRELAATAARQARPSPRYTDVTVAFSKSISVLHASIRANIRAAELARDAEGEAYWTGREAAFQEILQGANLAAMRHAERYAQVRTGYHGRQVDGQQMGRYETALPVVSSWLQGTNRDGDPHDHVHNLWARMARTAADGRWRALDTMTLRNQLPAMSAIASAYVEAELAREFGVEWAARADGAGNEIRGITQAQMDAYSSRHQEMDEELKPAAREFEHKYGRAPSRAELMHLRDAIKRETRKSKPEGAIDWGAQAQAWDAKLSGELAPIAGNVSAMRAPGARIAAPRAAPAWEPTREALAATVSMALAAVQADKASWTRADLLRQVQVALPAASRSLGADALVRLGHELTDAALRGEYDQVVCLDAPEWPALPDYLRRDLDGRSVYTRPGTEKYATQVQLSMEERLVQAAQRQGAPCLSREDAARALGADAQELDAALRERAQDARASGAQTATGLRLDQGAAAFHLLTSPRAVEVLVGPAGSGKTHDLAAVAAAWMASGREVVGLSTSQMGANALAEAGIRRTYNLAQFLGHAREQRGARGVRDLAPETLLIVDEASMTSTPDALDIAELTVRGGHKAVFSGDHAQLHAVESGGAMGLLVSRLGHVQLAEAQRFIHPWEAAAGLRLRAGDVTALQEYEDHGRLRGGRPDQVKAEARRLYVSHYLEGTDAELVVWQREVARELAEAVRSDLQHLGLVDRDGPQVAIAEGGSAAAGDIIRARTMDHRISVATNDVLRIESVNDDGSVTVRRAGERDKTTGKRTWSADTLRYRGFRTAELAYSSTAHAKQGATVTVGIPVVTGGETAEWLYSAMTRGAWENVVYAYTEPARQADPQPGTRAAPELAQQERADLERAGLPVPEPEPDAALEPREVTAVLADIVERTGAEPAALELQRQNLANADHLGRLETIWDGETRDLRVARYRQAVTSMLPAELHEGLDTHQATWLWRTLEAAEAAGLDVRDVADRALRDRPLDGARNIAAVIDARIRKDAGSLLPSGALRPWSEQVPVAPEPERQRYLEELAAAMDARADRLAEFTAETSPAWAVAALGPVPEHPLERLEWERRARPVAAYRERFGWEHPDEPIGAEPAGDSPKSRAAWHAAYAAMNRDAGSDMSVHGDGTLLRMREQYRREYEWAPAYVASELRAVRAAAIDQRAVAVRAEAEAAVARQRGDDEVADRHATLASSARSLAEFYQQRTQMDEEIMADRAEWERATEGTRLLALRADAEIRRRHPDACLEPVTSGEGLERCDEPPQPEGRAEAEARTARLAAARARFRQRLEERQNVMIPAEDPDYEPEGEAWPSAWPGRDRDAILQPPKPELRPAPQLERSAELEAEL